MKSKVENGEVIEAFREKFNELVVKESSGEYYAIILPKDIHEDDEYSLIDVEAFITNALNQQEKKGYLNGHADGRWAMEKIKNKELNQQRLEIVEEIKSILEISSDEMEVEARINEFLTKLEK